MKVFIMGFLARAFFTIPIKFFFSLNQGGIPRSPSLPPSAITRMSAPLLRAQVTLRKPPAEVSPLTPAFTIMKGEFGFRDFLLNESGVSLVKV